MKHLDIDLETDRELMLKDLRKGACEVIFTKKNTNEERTMVCSLSPQLLPEVEDRPKKESKVVENPDVIRVYDLEVEGWRSFRVDSVISFLRVEWPNES